MITIKYNQTDLRYIFLYGDEIKQIESHLNKIPQYMFLPSYNGIPKPEVFLHKFKSKNNKITIFNYHLLLPLLFC